MKIVLPFTVASAAFFFAATAVAQQSGTVTNHAFAIGKGVGQTGFTSLLCGSAQLAVGQSAADPICRTISGDVTLAPTGVMTIGTSRVTSAMLNADVFSTAHSWSGQQTFVAPILGTPASATLTNATGLPISTGVTGLGSGVATFLATPSSANLRSALSDESGTGAAVFADSPALTGTPTAPTAAGNDNSAKIATTAYVDAQVAGSVAGVASIANRTGVIAIDGGNLSSNVLAVPRYDAAQSLTSSQQLQARGNIGAVARTVGTPVPLTTQTSVTFSSLPAGITRFTISFAGVSTNGTSSPIIQLGDSGGIETTGYLSAGALPLSGGANFATSHTDGFAVLEVIAASVWHGSLTFSLLDASTNTWAMQGVVSLSDTVNAAFSAGSKSLSGELTQVRLTTSGGTNQFDAGKVNILYDNP